MKKIAILMVFAAFVFFGCDIIEAPYVIPTNQENVTVEFPALDLSTVYRKVLIEEYTGHRCTNCPSAHLVLEDLHERFGDTLAIVGIHATSLANTSNRFPYNFHTPAGDALAEDFGINAIPAAIINREYQQGGWPKDEWLQKINQVDRSQVRAAIQVINQYDADLKLKVNTKVTMLEDNDHPLRLSVFLIEDGIVKPQMSNTTTIEDYTHNHVLRAALNGTYGQPYEDAMPRLTEFTYACSVSFAEHDWNAANCTVVVFLYDVQSGEVVQVETAPVLQ